MKTKPHLILAAALTLTLGTSVAMAQDDRKPDSPPNPPPAPEAATPPPAPSRPAPPSPGREGRHGEMRGEMREKGPRPPEEGRRTDGPRRGDGDRKPDGDRRSEGDHRSEGGPRPEMGRHSERSMHMPMMPMMPPAPPKPTPYVGVATTPLPPVLTSQLSLPDGFGLVVGEVLPDSPAAKAGLQKYDVLTKFNDQQIVGTEQLSTLVRAAGKDTDATLTYVRKAKEEKATVKIGERLMPPRRPFPGMGDMHRDMDRMHGPGMENMKKFQERARDFGKKAREFQERMKDWQKNPSAEAPSFPEVPDLNVLNEPAISPSDILREARPGGLAQIHLLQPDGAVTYHTADTRMLIKDDSGEIQISANDGQRTLLAKDAEGATVFEGPIDTEEQRKALPDDIRKKIEMIEVRTNVAQFEGPQIDPATGELEVQ